jgi:hypothetical protein
MTSLVSATGSFVLLCLPLTQRLEIITLHTFSSIWWRWGEKAVNFARIVVVSLWLYLVLFISISTPINRIPPFYAPTPVSTVFHEPFNRLMICAAVLVLDQ